MEFLQDNWYWAALAAISGGWLVFDMIQNYGDKSQLSPLEATLLMNREDAQVVDVRDIGQFQSGHIPNARHIPITELQSRTAELEKLKSTPLILCCASGMRSRAGLLMLKKAGFEKIFHLRGGMHEWEKSGQPVSQKTDSGKSASRKKERAREKEKAK